MDSSELRSALVGANNASGRHRPAQPFLESGGSLSFLKTSFNGWSSLNRLVKSF